MQAHTTCATCKFFERAFPHNRQLGYCKGIQVGRLDGGGIVLARRTFAWQPGVEALRLLDDFGCVYHEAAPLAGVEHEMV